MAHWAHPTHRWSRDRLSTCWSGARLPAGPWQTSVQGVGFWQGQSLPRPLLPACSPCQAQAGPAMAPGTGKCAPSRGPGARPRGTCQQPPTLAEAPGTARTGGCSCSPHPTGAGRHSHVSRHPWPRRPRWPWSSRRRAGSCWAPVPRNDLGQEPSSRSQQRAQGWGCAWGEQPPAAAAGGAAPAPSHPQTSLKLPPCSRGVPRESPLWGQEQLQAGCPRGQQRGSLHSPAPAP